MSKTVPEILEAAAATYRERNAIYKDNFLMVGKVLEVLHGPTSSHPLSSLPMDAAFQSRFDLYRMIIGKLTRFAESGLTHVDSIHDACVYAAMVESLTPSEADAVHLVDLPLPPFTDSARADLYGVRDGSSGPPLDPNRRPPAGEASDTELPVDVCREVSLFGDPPTPEELEAARRRVVGEGEGEQVLTLAGLRTWRGEEPRR